MSCIRIRLLLRFGVSLAVLIAGTPATCLAAESELTLAEAERLAFERAPFLQHHRTNAQSAAERAVYEGRLPDPQLTLGAVNVPTDSWSLDQEDMTMLSIGVRQAFPPGDTLKLRSRRAEKELSREEARLELERRNLQRQVRFTWLELYYQEESLRLLAESREIQRRSLEATEGRYRAAQEPQQAVLRQRQMLARLDEREAMLHAQTARLRAQLARWIAEAAQQPLPKTPPILPPVPEAFDPTRHPEWLAAQAGLESAATEVEIARQEYKPGYMLDFSYGARQPAPSGQVRSNVVTALVTMDLPLFTGKRQDRRLAEKLSMENAARYEIEDKRRELEAMYAAARAEHEALARRVQIYSEQLLPAIQRETRITTAGFARDLAERRDAQLRELDARLEYNRLITDLARSRVELLYLLGE